MQAVVLKLARRQARKRQRFFEDLKMVLQAVFLLTVAYAGIFLLGITMSVLG